MNPTKTLWASALMCAVMSACSCPGPLDVTDDQTPPGEEADGGDGGSTGFDPGLLDADCDGLSDAEEETAVYAGGNKTNPKVADTDGDGIGDGVEQGRTQSKNLACTAFVGDLDPASKTDPTLTDTDGDGLADGAEDANKDGQRTSNETDPSRKDTDCDGLIDGPDVAGGAKGEDQNKNGVVDTGETSPLNPDTDGDGLRDGVERSVSVNPDPGACPNTVLDANPNNAPTDPLNPDSDGDGIPDGAEDSNQNGSVDPGELDPGTQADGTTGPVSKVCPVNKLRPVTFAKDGTADLQVALPAAFDTANGGEVKTMTVGGKNVGLIGYDPSSKVAFIAWKQAAPTGATTPATDEAGIRAGYNVNGSALSNVITQNFTTWDGIAAMQAFYDQSGTEDIKVRANAIANAVAGAGAGALTANTGTVGGPFKLQAEYVHRANHAVVVVLALTPLSNYKEPAIFTVTDTAGGSALAQFADTNAVQCEKFTATRKKVDFLFVVDNSGSMGGSQAALQSAADAMASALNNSSLDWRIAMVTTAHYSSAVLRPFTTNIDLFKHWLGGPGNSSCVSNACDGFAGSYCAAPNANTKCSAIGTGGTGDERMLQSVRAGVNEITPFNGAVNAALTVRADATLVVIGMGDADDHNKLLDNGNLNPQSPADIVDIQDYVAFFNATGTTDGTTKNKLGTKVVFHGIVCPDGNTCNGELQYDVDANPLRAKRNGVVIGATGGVRGDLCLKNNGGAAADCSQYPNVAQSMTAIVNSTIAAAGYKMQKPPIGASVKVAVDRAHDPAACVNLDDVPRSRDAGFDFDGVNRTISLFGGCRPPMDGGVTEGAVSYRYWIDMSPQPGGPCSGDPNFDPNAPNLCKGRRVCNPTSSICECAAACGGCGAGTQCNPTTCSCDPGGIN